MKPTFAHKVSCAVCGKTGTVEIDKKTGKILGDDWWYWGKIHNPDRDKYFYVIADAKDPTISLDHPKRTPNPKYNPEAKRYLGEYWEDRLCFSKVEEK